MSGGGTRFTITCGPFSLDSATAQANQIVAGASQPTTTIGFVHALSLAVTASGIADIRFLRGGVVVHDAYLLDGHAKFPPSDIAMGRKLKEKAPGPEVVDEILLAGTVTFVLEAIHEGDPDDYDDAVSDLRERLPRMVLARRYSGGSLHPVGRLSGLVSQPLGPGEVAKHFASMRPGFMLTDRHDHLAAGIAEGQDPLDVIMDTVAFRPRDGGGVERVTPGSLVPIAVGFRALEKPRRRRTNRSSDPSRLHAFTDPLTSVGEWTHTRRIAKAETPLEGRLWAPFVDEALGLYYASASRSGVTPGSLPSHGA